jgi:hypothetical protein
MLLLLLCGLFKGPVQALGTCARACSLERPVLHGFICKSNACVAIRAWSAARPFETVVVTCQQQTSACGCFQNQTCVDLNIGDQRLSGLPMSSITRTCVTCVLVA